MISHFFNLGPGRRLHGRVRLRYVQRNGKYAGARRYIKRAVGQRAVGRLFGSGNESQRLPISGKDPYAAAAAVSPRRKARCVKGTVCIYNHTIHNDGGGSEDPSVG